MKKSVEREVAEHFSGEVARLVRERYDGNQSLAARSLGMTQSHISSIITGTRGPGLNALLMMRNITGRSIDELLGLPRSNIDLAGAATASVNVDTLAHALAAALAPRLPAPPTVDVDKLASAIVAAMASKLSKR